ncbi:MAG: hypothetical protein ACRDKG_06140, partial [Actinomycetota bacterium]
MFARATRTIARRSLEIPQRIEHIARGEQLDCGPWQIIGVVDDRATESEPRCFLESSRNIP